jgi:hypothetical protein
MATQVDGRRSPRSKVLFAGTLVHDGMVTTVRISDLSRNGALVTGEGLPGPENFVKLKCGNQTVSGWVSWVRENQAGLSFAQEVSQQSFGKTSCNTSQFVKIRGRRDSTYRRPGFRKDELSAEEKRFAEQLLMDGAVPLPRI